MLKGYKFDDGKLSEIGLNKSFTRIRPEHMEPKGEISLKDMFKTINEQRDRFSGNDNFLYLNSNDTREKKSGEG